LIRRFLAAAITCVAVHSGDIAIAQRVSDVKDSVLEDVTALPDALDVEKSASDFVIAPIPISNPTIGTGLAVATAYLYRFGGSTEPSFTGGGAFRVGESWGAGIAQSARFGGNRYRVDAFAGFASVEYDFFGVGSDAGDRGSGIPIQQEGAAFAVVASFRIFEGVFVGMKAHYLDSRISLDLRRAALVGITIPEIEFNVTSGVIGPVFDFDRRDDRFNPSDGYRVAAEFVHSVAEQIDGLEFHRTRVNADLYFPVWAEDTVAMRLSLCGVGGRSPFFELCLLGGPDGFRGYPSGQFRDKALISGQAEYRGRISGRFGYVLFVGLGSVSSDLGDFDSAVPAGGAGLRYRVSKQFGLDLSLDGAFGRGSSAAYVYLGQRF
jgi:hypothetical protein